ncbi:protease modulator HflC [Thiohalobacter sp.]|uniref:protease modulator HflC n=1 Tax=Thiohalobacter sp. TaxID=2025948 RepID=UPI0026343C66|nr:protease modulator HflC [Thiohalobacter sp.]
MGNLRIPALAGLLLVIVVGWMSVFTVDERERAILFHLGQIVRSDFEPGLHFMIPVYHNVRKFDRRILTLDAKPEQILTGEKKNVLVDYFAKWRITDVEAFYRSFGGREIDAASRMAQIIKDGLQSELGDRTIRAVVSGERKEIMEGVAQRANDKMRDFGIQIVDFRIKQIELPSNVAGAVFERMRAERERIAKEHRALGEKAARIIRARADRARTEILAEARRKSDEIRGAGEAQATEIYAKAYDRDREFYDFYRSLQAYRTAFRSSDDLLVLEPDSEFFRYFGSHKSR